MFPILICIVFVIAAIVYLARNNPSTVDSVLAGFQRTVDKLEALAEKHLDAADAHRIEASNVVRKAQEAAESRRSEADRLVSEASKALRASSRIQSLLK